MKKKYFGQKCSEAGCDGVARKRGFCGSHYNLIWVRKRTQKKFERVLNFMPEEQILLKKSKLNSETGCIEWTGRLTTSGYGHLSSGFGDDRKQRSSHVVSWEIANKQSAEGFVVMHKCDNRKCINPDHLMRGTQADNVLDMRSKGRNSNCTKCGGFIGLTSKHELKCNPSRNQGSKCKTSKLNEEKVKQIHSLLGQGIKQRDIAISYKIDPSIISDIHRRKRWNHVEVTV